MRCGSGRVGSDQAGSVSRLGQVGEGGNTLTAPTPPTHHPPTAQSKSYFAVGACCG